MTASQPRSQKVIADNQQIMNGGFKIKSKETPPGVQFRTYRQLTPPGGQF
jgi:hypothetical protein